MANHTQIHDFTKGDWSDVCRGEWKCTYCKHPYKHEVVIVRTKRTPPPGGKDLGIFDEHTAEQFKCTGCDGVQSASRIFEKCSQCGTRAIHLGAALFAPQFSAYLLTHDYYVPGENPVAPVHRSTYTCVSHIKCLLCNQSLDEDGIAILKQIDKRSDEETTLYAHFHPKCAAKIKSEIERRRRDGVCIQCGGRFGFFAKRYYNDSHENCRETRFSSP